MSDNERIRVNDRRRFDRDGNPRDPEMQQASAEGAEARKGEASTPPPPPRHEEENEETVQQAQAGQPAPEPVKDPEVERLETELAAARKRIDELARAYQALDRDREDFKQRLTRERERMIDVERGTVAVGLLEAIDEIERAVAAAPDTESALAQGVRLIRDNLLRRVHGLGLERLEVVGLPFDPNVAEAADMELTADEADDQKVVEELRAGYRLKDQVVRPARVKVARYVKPANA